MKIAAITGSRADAGPLSKVLVLLGDNATHIKTEGLLGHESSLKAQLEQLKPDMVMLLGDRYETLVAASVSSLLGIPIAHIGGGEETEGAVDNAFRNAITKLAYWHFVANGIYAKRLIQMGEHPDRVFITGDPVADNLTDLFTKEECEEKIGIKLKSPVLLVTWHPETLGDGSVSPLIDALKEFPDATIVSSGSNEDIGNDGINESIASVSTIFKEAYGQKLYDSLMAHCDVVVGNSSSGVIQSCILGKPSVNIGDRQKGRLQANTIINSPCKSKSISRAILHGISSEYQPSDIFGISAKVSPLIVQILLNLKIPSSPQKPFYQIQP